MGVGTRRTEGAGRSEGGEERREEWGEQQQRTEDSGKGSAWERRKQNILVCHEKER